MLILTNDSSDTLNLLYNLAESSDYWESEFRIHLETSLKPKTFVSNPSFWFKNFNNFVKFLCANCMYKTLHTGNNIYSAEYHKLGKS